MNNAKILSKAILVNGNIMQDLSRRVTELNEESESIKNKFEDEKLYVKRLRSETLALENVIKNYKLDIKLEIQKKFKIEKNWSFLDHMEMTIIKYMLVHLRLSDIEETRKHYTKEESTLKVNYQSVLLKCSILPLIINIIYLFVY